MHKIFLKNIIEDSHAIHKLSRESLIKLIDAAPSYLGKTLIELIDDKIKTLENENLIEISNIRVNDIKSTLSKSKYKEIKDLIDFKIYYYDHFNDIYFTGKQTDRSFLIKKLSTHINLIDFKTVYLSSRTIKNPHIFIIKEHTQIILWGLIESKLKTLKNIESVKLRFNV